MVGRNLGQVGPEPIGGFGVLPAGHQGSLEGEGRVTAIGSGGGHHGDQAAADLTDELPGHEPHACAQARHADGREQTPAESNKALGDEIDRNQAAEHQPGQRGKEDHPDPHDPIGGIVIDEVGPWCRGTSERVRAWGI